MSILRVSVSKHIRSGQVIVNLLLFIGALATLFPLLWMFSTSFKEPTIVLEKPPQLFFWPPVLKNYLALLRYNNGVIFKWLFNSALVSGSVTVGNVFFGTLAGYTLAKGNFPGRQAIFWVVVGIMMIPSQLTIVPLFIIITELGWLNSYMGLILPTLVSPFGIFLMKQFLQTIPDDLLDAARIDGCNELGVFARVIVHLAKPGMAVLGIFTFVQTWNAFVWPLVVTTSNTMRTLQPGLAQLQIMDTQTNYGLLMAGSSFASIPMFIVFFVFQRYFVQGITVGALKG